MSEKEKLIKDLIKKTSKSEEELNKLIKEKIEELSGLVSEEGAIYIIANELGVKLENEKSKVKVSLEKIENIKESKVPISLVCKIIKKYNKVTFSTENNPEGNVQSILVGDETGIIRITFWNDKTELLENIVERDIIKITNAYTRENNQNPGRIEIHYGQYSDIEVNPKDVEINLKEFNVSSIEFDEKKISELEEGNKNISISGVVTDFEIPRFYFGCPECFKKVFQDENLQKCSQHEEVKAIKIPIVNIIIDDGSGIINVVGFRNRAEEITKFNSEEIIKLTEDINKYKSFSKRIIGSKIKLGGNVSVNNLSGELQVLANQIIELKLKEIKESIEELSKEVKKNKVLDIKEDEIDDLDIEEIDIDDDML